MLTHAIEINLGIMQLNNTSMMLSRFILKIT